MSGLTAMSITNTAKDFEKCAGKEKLPEYLKNLLFFGKSQAGKKVIQGVRRATVATAKGAKAVAAVPVKAAYKGIKATGHQLYHNPKTTLTAMTLGGAAAYRFPKELNKNLRHIDPNQHVTKEAVPGVKYFGQQLTSPIPFRSIKYKNKQLQDHSERSLNLF